MAITRAAANTLAEEIRDELTPNANTATRVGGLLVGLVASVPFRPAPAVWKLRGPYSAGGVGNLEPWILIESITLERVTIFREIAGSAGETRVDLLIGGASRFANDAAKPKVLFGAGDNKSDTKTAFTSAVITATPAAPALLVPEIEAVEDYLAGPPEGPDGLVIRVDFTFITP